MSNLLKPGAKVVILKENNEIERGTIRTLYDDTKIAVVELDDGEVKKIPYPSIEVEQERDGERNASEPTEEKIEPTEKAQITITPEEFENISCAVIAKEVARFGVRGILLAELFTIFGVKLQKALFCDAVEND